MDIEVPPTSFALPLRSAWRGLRHALLHTARAALDVALPTLCVA
jgi:hypothetical protein